jgi:hypothetical protein
MARLGLCLAKPRALLRLSHCSGLRLQRGVMSPSHGRVYTHPAICREALATSILLAFSDVRHMLRAACARMSHRPSTLNLRRNPPTFCLSSRFVIYAQVEAYARGPAARTRPRAPHEVLLRPPCLHQPSADHPPRGANPPTRRITCALLMPRAGRSCLAHAVAVASRPCLPAVPRGLRPPRAADQADDAAKRAPGSLRGASKCAVDSTRCHARNASTLDTPAWAARGVLRSAGEACTRARRGRRRQARLRVPRPSWRGFLYYVSTHARRRARSRAHALSICELG